MRVLLLSLGLFVVPFPAISAETSPGKPAWPTTVQATYSLRYNGIEVGQLKFKSSATADSYSLSSSGKVSVLFGTFKWQGASSVSGTIQSGAPAPAAYKFNWRMNDKKGGKTEIAFRENVASEIAIKPAPRPKSDTVPLLLTHKTGALDPMSAVMMLTKADDRPPCDRRVGIFDGKARYDIVFSPKRTEKLTASVAGGKSETGYVCRVTYEPIAGHRDNEDTRTMVANRDVEIVLRRIPGSQMLIPYSVSIPTSWGTGTMVTEKIEVTAGSGKIALTN
jgi:hypothetical protein